LAKVTGVRAIRAKLKQMSSALALKTGQALYQEALIEQKESMRRTPVDTGALRASHETSDFKFVGNTIEVAIKVGGPAAPYAVTVHEDLEAHHKVGQAKFLESTLRESAPFMLERVASRVKLI